MTKQENPRLSGDFSPTSFEEWHTKVVGDLKGADFDRALAYRTAYGFEAEALYHPENATGSSGLPGAAPFTRGFRLPAASDRPAWEIGQIVDVSDPAEANRRLLTDLALGPQRLWLRLGRDGVDVRSAADMDRLLQGVEPSFVRLMVDGDDVPGNVVAFVDWLERRGRDLGEIQGGVGADPMARLARRGTLPEGLESAWAHAMTWTRWSLERAPGLRTLRIDTTAYHDAGASPVQELATALGLGVELLRRGQADGLEAGAVAGRIDTVFAVGRDLFLEIAKLRAWRRLWASVLEACGAEAAVPRQTIHLLPSASTATRVDPWVNMLRSTAQIFIGAVAGVDSITVDPFDRILGIESDHSRRVALNAHHVLAEECHLAQVADPAGGSWAIESLSERLATQAWALFQDFESAVRGSDDGFAHLLVHGRLQSLAAASAEARRRALAKRKDVVVGVSMFANPGEERPRSSGSEPSDSDAKYGDGSDSEISRWVGTWQEPGDPLQVEALPVFRHGAAFEDLRSAVDGMAERPRVLVLQLGSPKEARARAQFAMDVFAAAGLETVTVDLGADAEAFGSRWDDAKVDPAPVAVLCSTDERYVEAVPSAAAAAKSRGVSRLFLAGRPADHEAPWRRAGIDGFIFMGCDIHGILLDLLPFLGLEEDAR